MRSIRVSVTFTRELQALLTQGLPNFGATVVNAKSALVQATIGTYLVHFPATGRLEPEHGLYIWTVRRTPFVLLYDFDDAELRIHTVVHKNADRTALDPSNIEW